MPDQFDDPTSAIGRGRPPKHTRFSIGRSGNPKGRPKGSRNMAAVLEDEMTVRIAVTEGGRRKKITKREAVAKQLVNKAVAGDPKATSTVLTEERLRSAGKGVEPRDDSLSSPEDAKTIENVVKRLRDAFREQMASQGEARAVDAEF